MAWLQLTPKKVALTITAAIVLSAGTTIYMDSLNSNLPSDFEQINLWTGLSHPPATKGSSWSLIDQFAKADSLRQTGKYAQAAANYALAIKQWNESEAQDLPGAIWTVSTSKAYFGLGLCQAKLSHFRQANDCYQEAIDYGQNNSSMPLGLFKDMQKTYERNQWKVNPVKAIMRVLSNQEMLPPGAS